MDMWSYLSRREIILTNLHYSAICFSDEWYDDHRGARDRFTAQLDTCNARLAALDLEAAEHGTVDLDERHRLFRTSGAG